MIYLTIIAVGWFITEFEPLHFLLNAVKDKLPKSGIVDFFFGAFGCWQCMAFWTGLIISQDFFTACVASLGSLLIERWIEK